MCAGLNVCISAAERIEVDGMEGEVHFLLLSTAEGVITTIIGGLGNDTFDIGGDVTKTIVASSVEGRSGFINHAMLSEDPAFNGMFAEGIRLNIADGSRNGPVKVEQ